MVVISSEEYKFLQAQVRKLRITSDFLTVSIVSQAVVLVLLFAKVSNLP